MLIELLHPITHGEEGEKEKTEYTRGIHDLPNELAEKFLMLRAPSRLGPIVLARLPVPAEAPKRGTATRVKG